jgi:hypothetical protein
MKMLDDLLSPPNFDTAAKDIRSGGSEGHSAGVKVACFPVARRG